jgi:hypothetical protein
MLGRGSEAEQRRGGRFGPSGEGTGLRVDGIRAPTGSMRIRQSRASTRMSGVWTGESLRGEGAVERERGMKSEE